MKILGIIPARFNSSRFPGKPLAQINGHPMIEWVYSGALESSLLTDLYVATDHQGIYQAVLDFGGKAILTSSLHETGTERCYEALNLIDQPFDALINIQGDEPLIQAAQIDLLAKLISKPEVDLATLCTPISNKAIINNPNNIKVVFDHQNRALLFSRSPIPFPREKKAARYFEHIGMYAYKLGILEKIVHLKPGHLERSEKLEQLRWMENGYSIYLSETKAGNISVDTPEDLQKVIKSIRTKRLL